MSSSNAFAAPDSIESIHAKAVEHVTREMLAKSSEGVPLIGWFAYWSITNVKAKREDVLALVGSLNLSTDAVLPIRKKSAFIRAVDEVAKSQDARHQKIIDNEVKCVYVIVKTLVDPVNEGATFTIETKATFLKGSETVDVQGPMEAEIRAGFEDLSTHYYSDQFRDMILRLLDAHCEYITIRDRGGIYFVPSIHEIGLNKVRKLFSHFPECYLATVGVANMVEAKRDMWRSLVGELSSELTAMKEDFSNMNPECSDSSLQVRLERYKALREKVENYEIVLSGTAEDLKADLASLQTMIEQQLTG